MLKTISRAISIVGGSFSIVWAVAGAVYFFAAMFANPFDFDRLIGAGGCVLVLAACGYILIKSA